MKLLYLLKPNEKLGEQNPWKPWYDKCFGFIICAESEKEARTIAACNDGDERIKPGWGYALWKQSPWKTDVYSSCVVLGSPESKVEIGVIMMDFAAG
jgi:hypothetical protein